MKYEVKIWTEKGCFALPLNGYYKTKKEADQVAENARQIKETIKAEVIKKKEKGEKTSPDILYVAHKMQSKGA